MSNSKKPCLEFLNLSRSKKFIAPLNTGKMYPDKSTGFSQMVYRIRRLIWWNKIKWMKLYAVINASYDYLKCFIEIIFTVFTVSNEKDPQKYREKCSNPMYNIGKTWLKSCRTFSDAFRKYIAHNYIAMRICFLFCIHSVLNSTRTKYVIKSPSNIRWSSLTLKNPSLTFLCHHIKMK